MKRWHLVKICRKYIGATKTEQSKIVWNEIKAQMNGCEDLKRKFNIAYGKIEHLKTDSFISALSKDAEIW